MAVQIAALLAGADLADENKEDDLARYCRQTADSWNDSIEYRSHVTDTPDGPRERSGRILHSNQSTCGYSRRPARHELFDPRKKPCFRS
ncbi:hypothetical protein RQM65_02735 [Pricia sp. S334]|uniref:Uncharacterized protein n=1 Tax=Pricia mediterranea TaxID=3076079 RepID=A0ABU3L1U4_9FLAO|nr:hypothetical protein [Pricia sp. S334]MDT7827580.1 hypothetical protein [Pricia sp. S334]